MKRTIKVYDVTIYDVKAGKVSTVHNVTVRGFHRIMQVSADDIVNYVVKTIPDSHRMTRKV